MNNPENESSEPGKVFIISLDIEESKITGFESGEVLLCKQQDAYIIGILIIAKHRDSGEQKFGYLYPGPGTADNTFQLVYDSGEDPEILNVFDYDLYTVLRKMELEEWIKYLSGE